MSQNRKSLVQTSRSLGIARLALIRSIGTITAVHDGRQGFIYCASRRIILFNSWSVLRPESHRRGHNGRRRHRYLSLNFLNESLRAYANQCAACTRIFVELYARCIRFISEITHNTRTWTIIKLNRLFDNERFYERDFVDWFAA